MPTRKQQTSHDDSLVLAPKKAAIKPPPLYKVLLLNDDYTPMDFVVVVLQKFFAMSVEQATIVMLQVHRQGKGVCGIYPRDVANTKVAAVSDFAKQHQHPLACVMEES
jgi:ATP-dependent Clp protease adaptor protein ClpS